MGIFLSIRFIATRVRWHQILADLDFVSSVSTFRPFGVSLDPPLVRPRGRWFRATSSAAAPTRAS
eukprot:6197982-Pleurochrysis_carterae.AAC.1